MILNPAFGTTDDPTHVMVATSTLAVDLILV